MIEPQLSYKNASNKVVLEVRTKLMSIDDKPCEQVLKVIELLDIKVGAFGLFVNKKITGQSNMTNAVKIIGPAHHNPHFLFLKFQTSDGECYEGNLSLRVNGGEMEYASRLHEKFKKITGIGWFDPERPETKQVGRPLVATAAPIARVTTALFTAAVNVVAKPKNGHSHAGRLPMPQPTANVLVPITTATARYKRLMNIRADIADLEAKKSKIQEKIDALNKKAGKKILVDAEAAMRAAGVDLSRL